MKNIFALCLMLLAPLPVWAEPADMNFYIMYWPEGEEDEPTSSQIIELEGGNITIFTSVDPNAAAEQEKSTPATPEQIAYLSAAVAATLRTVSTEMGTEYNGDKIAVEWSISNINTFERGSTLFRPDALPAEVYALQDKLFGARLAR